MIGICYKNIYAVTETFQLLKIPWEWYDPTKSYDVVIAKKNDVPYYCNNLIDLTDNDTFQKVSDLLNNGKMHLHQPDVEYLLDELRTHLKKYTTLVEIPPSPWNHPYMVALTHDVDNISAKQSPLRSVCVAAIRCFQQYEFGVGINLLLTRFNLAKDPWDLFDQWRALERQLNVRSTFYIIPHYTKQEYTPHPYRDAHYIPDKLQLTVLQHGGWEVGVHGMNNWVKTKNGIEELANIKGSVGNRTHWLLHHDDSWLLLDSAGYEYDTTFGYDDDVGFRAGTTQVYQPKNTAHLLVLPLHIQDTGLFGETCWAPSKEQWGEWERIPCLNAPRDIAINLCKGIFQSTKRFGGVATIIWHYESIVPPRDWKLMYIELVNYAKSDGAWVTTANNIVDWFRSRRTTVLGYTKGGNKIIIYAHQPPRSKNSPDQKVRLHIDNSKIALIDSEYVAGNGYVDIRCDRPEITVVLK